MNVKRLVPFSLLIALLFVVSTTYAQQGCITYTGLEYCPLGSAEISTDGKSMTVDNIGHSGKDGIAVSLDENWASTFHEIAPSPDNGLSFSSQLPTLSAHGRLTLDGVDDAVWDITAAHQSSGGADSFFDIFIEDDLRTGEPTVINDHDGSDIQLRARIVGAYHLIVIVQQGDVTYYYEEWCLFVAGTDSTSRSDNAAVNVNGNDYAVDTLMIRTHLQELPQSTQNLQHSLTVTGVNLDTITFTDIKPKPHRGRDLGDAPDSTNHVAGGGMTAYSVPAFVPANYPTVWNVGTGVPSGPLHHNQKIAYVLGNSISFEKEADIGFDSDGVNNIKPAPDDIPDLDRYDDGLKLPNLFEHCVPTKLTYQVRVSAALLATDAYVNVWADWDRNGQWGETFDCPTGSMGDEWAVQNQLLTGLTPGIHTFTTPAFLPAGHQSPNLAPEMWLRIMLSDKPATATARDGSGPNSGYEYGETEDYLFKPVDDPQDQPDLTIEKTHVGEKFTIGQTGTYHINVTNVGTAPTTGLISVTDTLPAGLSYVAGGGGGWTCGAVGANVTCTHPGPLNPGDSAMITLLVSVGVNAPATITNCARVQTHGDNNSSNDTHCDEVEVCHPFTDVVTVGTNDNFDSTVPDNPAAAPSTGLVTSINAVYPFPPVGFDNSTVNRWFAHTFTNLQQDGYDICGARLTFSVQPNSSSLDFNDTVGIRFTAPDGSQITSGWGRRIGTSGAVTGLLPFVWGDASQTYPQVITVDLANLPTNSGPISLLDELNLYGFFDFIVQDDTAVDYLSLRVNYCCCDSSTTILQGRMDNFDMSDGTESTLPSTDLQNWMTTNYPSGTRDFDETTWNRYFGTTFSGLISPNNGHRQICGAWLEIRMRPSHWNDTLALHFVDGSGLTSGWGRYLGGATGLTGGSPWTTGQPDQTFMLDLSALPNVSGPPTNLLPMLNAFGFVDVMSQDDTAVDYVMLTVNYCCEKSDLGDAPASSNHDGSTTMTTYGGTVANFPTVYDAPIPGPKHFESTTESWLGRRVTSENDADLLPDEDGGTNIVPTANAADRDVADDGVHLDTVNLPDCGLTKFDYDVYRVGTIADLYLNVWFDFNRDGDWEDTLQCVDAAGVGQTVREWAVPNQVISVAAGLNTLTTPSFAAMSTVNTDQWMRVTLSEAPAPAAGDGRGLATGYRFGETEDYLVLREQQPCDEPGTIFGTAYDGNGNPLPNIQVVVYEFDGTNWNPIATATTDASGNYSVNVPGGTYRVHFTDPANNYQSIWHGGSTDVNDAADVTVHPCETIDGVDGRLKPVPQDDDPIKVLDGNAQVVTDPATGQTTIIINRQTITDLTLCVRIECPDGSTPTNVMLHYNGNSYPMTDAGGGNFVATIPAADLLSGSGAISVTWDCDDGSSHDLPVGGIELHDPSGYITDALTGDPIVGATVSLFYVPGWRPSSGPGDVGADVCESNLSKSSGDPWSQPAPTSLGVQLDTSLGRMSPAINQQPTDETGWYGWDVAVGCWYVTVSADGYTSIVSPVVGVPPEVTDLDLEMTPDIPTAVTLQGTTAQQSSLVVLSIASIMLIGATAEITRRRRSMK